MNLKISATSMLWSNRLFSSINMQNYEIGVAELPLQGNICSQSLDFIPAEAPGEIRIRLSALAQLLPQAAGRVSSVQEAVGGKAWGSTSY